MRRYRNAVVLALLLAVLAIGAKQVMDVAVPDICASLDPDTNWFLWWLNRCSKDAAGGGGGGVG